MTADQHADDAVPRPAAPPPEPDSPPAGPAPRCPDRPRPRTRLAASGPQPPEQVLVSSPASVLAIVPHLLGFHPSRSLVVLGVSGRRDQVCLAFRYDLPDPPDADLAADIAAHACAVLAREALPAAIVVGYGLAAPVRQALEPVAAAMLHAGLEILEMLRAEGGRYWSALCRDPVCCPAEGVSFDPCSHPAAAVLNQAGLDAYPDRAALARTLEPPPGTALATRRATTRALRRLDALVAAAEQGGTDPAIALAGIGRRAVREAIRRYRSGGSITSPARRAFLAVAVADLQVRDDAWARMDPEYRDRHLRLWTDVVTGAAPEFVPAPASLLAFTAWQSGAGALANVAVERALAADPAYTMALLIADAVQAGLPPSAAQLPMTPAEVAASYGGGRAPRARAGQRPAPRGRKRTRG
jgi:hypothetical protein